MHPNANRSVNVLQEEDKQNISRFAEMELHSDLLVASIRLMFRDDAK